MAATTLDRNTLKRGPIRQIKLALAAATTIPSGVMVSVATPSAGAVNASQTATHVVMGLSAQRAVTTEGDVALLVEKGIFKIGNNGNITAVHVGSTAFVVDNQTVGLAADTNPDIPAGLITEIDPDGGVWVDMTHGFFGA